MRAIIEIWTNEEAEFHGKHVDFDPIYSWPKPSTTPHPPLLIGGGPANFERITRLGDGWISMSPSARALSGQLDELRAVAGHDVPVININMGKLNATAVQGYRDIGVEHLLVELPTEPRDESLRRLDELQSQLAELA